MVLQSHEKSLNQLNLKECEALRLILARFTEEATRFLITDRVADKRAKLGRMVKLAIQAGVGHPDFAKIIPPPEESEEEDEEENEDEEQPGGQEEPEGEGGVDADEDGNGRDKRRRQSPERQPSPRTRGRGQRPRELSEEGSWAGISANGADEDGELHLECGVLHHPTFLLPEARGPVGGYSPCVAYYGRSAKEQAALRRDPRVLALWGCIYLAYA
jgi:hypothetical protein